MTLNIAEQVLTAFQVEYREHLEGIRAMLARLEDGRACDRRECIDQAFRLAHSLKGGARVCDLRPVEELGHRLEAVFERVRNGALELDDDVAATIKLVLDAVEDWMAAREHDDPPPSSSAAATALERLLPCPASVESPHDVRPSEPMSQRLSAAFRAEYPKYLAELHQLAVPAEGEAAREDAWEEGLRVAHNLRAAADAAELSSLETVCGNLESLLRGFCDNGPAPEAEARKRLGESLAAIHSELQSLFPDETPGENVRHPGQVAGATGETDCEPTTPKAREAGPSATSQAADTVRVDTASLDALLWSSRRLLTECLGQDRIGRELEDVRRQIVDMRREHETIRHAAAGWRGAELSGESDRLARYLENVERDFRTLDRNSRRIDALHRQATRNLQSSARRIEADVGRTRLVSAESIYQGFRKMVRDLACEAGKQVDFRVAGFDVRADRMVFQALKDPLIHMLRNCVVHGIETPARRRESAKDALGRIDLRIETIGNRLTVEVEDDGHGIDRDRIYRRAVESGLLSGNSGGEVSVEELENLIYRPGFSTSQRLTEVAGRGMGLSVVREAVTRLQGDVQACRKDSPGAKFRITVPLTVSTHRLLLASLDERAYALPVRAVERLLRIRSEACESIEGKPIVTLGDRPIPLVDLRSLLGIPCAATSEGDGMLRIVVIKAGARRMAVAVDAFLSEQELLIQDLDVHAASRRYLGAVLTDDGEPVLVLNPGELLQGYRPAAERAVAEAARPRRPKQTPRVLVVDDSFTTRTLEKSILEANGFQVGIAVDGQEGLAQLQRERFDLVISDVEMPRMDGFGLLAAVKQDERLSSIPVVLVTSRDRREDREKGLDLGADAYIVKQKFDYQSWLSAIREIVGT